MRSVKKEQKSLYSLLSSEKEQLAKIEMKKKK